MFSRPSKESHEGTIHYEIRMLRHCADRIRTLTKSDPTPHELTVHLECFLLHFRNLAQFLSGKGGSKGDLRITNWKKWTDKQLTAAEVRQVTEVAIKAYEAYCGDISTYLSHCTRQRCEEEKSWEPQKMLGNIEPAIRAFEALFPASQGRVWTVVSTTSDAVSTATIVDYGKRQPD